MIAIDTSVILAMALGEAEADRFHAIVTAEEAAIGWPTLLEIRMVLAGRGFPNAAEIVRQLTDLPNLSAVPFDERHFQAAEKAFDRFGKGRHPAGLNYGDCFSYAVSKTLDAPLLFKGRDFSETDVRVHPASAIF